MNLPFTNKQLYPEAYGTTATELYLYRLMCGGTAMLIGDYTYVGTDEHGNYTASVVVDDNADRNKCTRISIDDINRMRIDMWLYRSLVEWGIDFNNLLHPFHMIDGYDLIPAICEMASRLYGHTFEACQVGGVPLNDLKEDQLRKLALLLYHKIGGTTA